jgi:hypothetical protein
MAVTPEPVAHLISKPASPVIPFPANRPSRVGSTVGARPVGAGETTTARIPRPVSAPERVTGGQDLSDMEIPTFIRRQMD